MKFIISTILILLFCASQIFSQATIFYVQAPNTNNSWNNPLNWNPNRLPIATDIVEIRNGHTVVLSGTNAIVKAIEINFQATLILDDPDVRLDIQGAPSDGLRMTSRGHLDIKQGTMAIRDAERDGIYMENFSTINNSGTLTVATYGDEGLYFKSNSEITNNGNLFIDQLNGGMSPICVNAVDGSFMNQSGGLVVVSKCEESPSTDLIQIANGVTYEDSGETIIWELNCF